MSSVESDHKQQVSILWHTAKSIIAVAEEQTVTVWVNGYADPHEVIRLYKTYKEDCLHLVDAASSFILYDAQTNLLIAARDLFGIYPLYYAHVKNRLLASFSIKDIVESKQITIAINRYVIAEYINGVNGNELINNQTFYENVYSLLPAHALVLKKGQLMTKSYCQLQVNAYSSLTDKAYIQQFKDEFIRSVHKAIKPFGHVATHLSGGLDSSSVCSVAQSLASEPVHSFFIQTNTPTTQEEAYVESVIEKWQQAGKPIVHQYVPPDETIYQDTKQYTSLIGLPNRLLLPVSTFLPVLRQAQQHDCHVLLSGHGGDQITGYGFDYLDVLFEKQDWKSLKTALNQYADQRVLQALAGTQPFRDAEEKRQAYTLQYFLEKIKHAKGIRNRTLVLWTLLTHFDVKISTFQHYILRRTKREKEVTLPKLTHLLRNEWINQPKDALYQEIDGRQLVAQEPTSNQKEQIDFVYGSLGIQYNEDITQLQAQYVLKTAHPFLDKKLLELSLNTPLQLRFADGLGRGLLRKALAGYLPEKVTMRLDKGEFSAYTQQAFKALYDEFVKQSDDRHPVWEIIDKSTFDAYIAFIFDSTYTIRQKNTYRFMASRVIYLAIWLDYLKTIST